jgi:hypothetical protein
MIQVAKSATVPRGLRRGVQLTVRDCAAFDADPAAYRAGTKKFNFNSGVYGAATVKAALKADQHDKCCFCEAIFDANVAGDVEHYRPKGEVLTAVGILNPGYYWLVYSWTNLYYACPDCNQYRKRSLFPLVDEAQRAADHHGVIGNETPLLLDPGGPVDPRVHIEFVGEVPRWRSPEGEQTIKILALDRDALLRDRRRYLAHLTRFHQTIALLGQDSRPDAIALVDDLRRRLADAVQPSAKFSAAAAESYRRPKRWCRASSLMVTRAPPAGTAPTASIPTWSDRLARPVAAPLPLEFPAAVG